MLRLTGFTVAMALALAAASAHAAVTDINESYFANAAEVGVDPFVFDAPTLLGFDYLPDGTPITPTVSYQGNAGTHVTPDLGAAFSAVGVTLGPGDAAITQPGNPGGIGVMSGSNTLTNNGSNFADAATDIYFSYPVSAAGLYVVDGPTNDTTVTFYGSNNQVLAERAATPLPTVQFIGIAASEPIAHINVITSQPDDYFVENLLYVASPVPEPASGLLLLAGALVLGRGRRTPKAAGGCRRRHAAACPA